VTSELEEASAPPEEPAGPAPDGGPGWPAWYAPAAFVTAVIAVFIVAAVVQVIVAATGHTLPSSGPGIALGGTLVQDVLLAGVAVLFASRIAPPKPGQFGLRAVPLGRAVGAAVAAYVAFLLFSVLYQAIFHPHGKQTVAKDLGADQGTFGMIAAGFMVICVAPVAEEFFFRGFFYRALRSRFSVLVAAVIDGVVFGAIHYTGAQTLSVIPVLAFLGFVFCMLYSHTGSIVPGIALHAINNSISYSVTVHSSSDVALALGAGVVAACIVVPRQLFPR
jgi:membrane protease YdiL (CAAX protease family)